MYYVEDGKFYITRGDDGALTLELLMDGAPIPLPGTLTLAVRARPAADSPVLLQAHSETGRILLPHDLTGSIDPGQYSADIQLDTPDGRRLTLWPKLEGRQRFSAASSYKNFIVMPEVVRNE